MNFNIRISTREDIPALFRLVKELADFEKMPKSVTVTIDEYYHEYDMGTYNAFVAEQKGNIIGIALFYKTFSTWKGKMMHLEDFIVEPEFRSLGVGQKLFDATITLAKTEGYKLLRWEVLDWNKRAILFYERNGATIEKCWWNGKIML